MSHTDPEPSFDEELSKALTTNPDDLPTDKTSSKSSPVVDNSSHTDLREQIKALPRPNHPNSNFNIEVELDVLEEFIAQQVTAAQMRLIERVTTKYLSVNGKKKSLFDRLENEYDSLEATLIKDKKEEK